MGVALSGSAALQRIGRPFAASTRPGEAGRFDPDEAAALYANGAVAEPAPEVLRIVKGLADERRTSHLAVRAKHQAAVGLCGHERLPSLSPAKGRHAGEHGQQDEEHDGGSQLRHDDVSDHASPSATSASHELMPMKGATSPPGRR